MAKLRELCVLVANRGEIALRLVRGLRELGVRSVAVYSEADRDAPYVGLADRAEPIGPAPPQESYLSAERILAAARRAGANAVHPGYGFLAENAEFAAAVEKEGLIFIGPAPRTIRALGEKTAARRSAEEAGVPVLPCTVLDPRKGTPAAAEESRKLGLPLLIKAIGGGGGKGTRIVRDAAKLGVEIESARREALAAFGDDRVYLERYIERARHVEVQILGDGRGAVVAAGDRDCTLQRRHQKILEESPAPALPARTRAALAEAALALGRAASYRSAGTVEFLLAPDGEFYFL
ncbi:MAG: ATP-grasp domain-containing protein, partial [Planctomycetes bacterium]|nr:ATP-grasp domain-containing protein [Planctomycetota bacterium]